MANILVFLRKCATNWTRTLRLEEPRHLRHPRLVGRRLVERRQVGLRLLELRLVERQTFSLGFFYIGRFENSNSGNKKYKNRIRYEERPNHYA